MSIVTNLDAVATNEGFGQLVGISRQAVAGHRKSGVLMGQTYREWLLWYTDHLRRGAAGRGNEDDESNLTAARARLAAEQADRVSMDNAVRRSELAPRALLESTLADAARQVVAVLDGVPAQVKRASAGIKSRELDIVKREIDKARAAIAGIRLAT